MIDRFNSITVADINAYFNQKEPTMTQTQPAPTLEQFVHTFGAERGPELFAEGLSLEKAGRIWRYACGHGGNFNLARAALAQKQTPSWPGHGYQPRLDLESDEGKAELQRLTRSLGSEDLARAALSQRVPA
jgi:hypothetical protein